MWYPKLKTISTTRNVIDAFGGYNHNLRIGEHEFYDMQNMTGDHYPLICVRDKRKDLGIYPNMNGMIYKNGLWRAQGTKIRRGMYSCDIGLSDGEKTMVSFGAHILIFPDKIYVNTESKPKDFDFGSTNLEYGSMENELYQRKWQITPCDFDGRVISVKYQGPDLPEDMEDGDYWYDTSGEIPVLKKYKDAWQEVDGYVRLQMIQDANPSVLFTDVFSSYDSINVEIITTVDGVANTILKAVGEGVDENVSELFVEAVSRLSADLKTLRIINDRTAIIPGIVPNAYPIGNYIRFKRTIPQMDYVFECGNRLWGCRFGKNSDGKMINEIYASALGDFKNFRSFKGVSTDSYIASVGSDGPFTGAINYNGNPLFFKENHLHRVYGSYPSQYQIQDTPCHGVLAGSSESLIMISGAAYFLSEDGVYVYRGAIPEKISDALGRKTLTDGKAGTADEKYYLCAKVNGSPVLMVYNAENGLWHKEDDADIQRFAWSNKTLYAQMRFPFENLVTTKIMAIGNEEEGSYEEKTIPWYVETGEIGLDSPDTKYIRSLNVRLSAELGTQIRFLVKYDFDQDWEMMYTMTADSLRSINIPLRPKRCDHMRLRIEGEGDCKIYSISKIITGGGQKP